MNTKQFFIGLSIILSIFLTSCGEDGKDGRAYLTIDYTGEKPIRYWDDNPDIPYGFSYGQQFETEGGITYNYEYGYSDGLEWWGTNYIYTPMSGSEGGMFSDGEDGDDSYCDFYCSRSGTYTDDGWYKSANNEFTIITNGEYTYETTVINGSFTDTIQNIVKRNGILVSIDKRWRVYEDSENDNKTRKN